MLKTSMGRVLFTSALGQAAWWIGVYGPQHPWVIAVTLIGTGALLWLGHRAIDRWQSRGYKRVSARVKVPSRVGVKPEAGDPAEPAPTA